MSHDVHIVIMAGGSGTRFWPASRRTRPKQLLHLLGETSLLEQTVARVTPARVSADRVLVVTGEHLREAVGEALGPDGAQVLVEPAARNTAPCIALAAARIAERDPQAVMAVLAADHHIADQDGFLAVFDHAVQVARTGRIVTLGICPNRPETGYGYTLQGTELEEGVYQVDAFVEKPDLETAKRYLADGRYHWNSGMFFMRADVFLAAVDKHLPRLGRGITAYRAALGTDGEDAALRAAFEDTEPISVDYGIMEHETPNIAVIPANFGWSDVGSWRTLLDFRTNGESCYVRGPATIVDSERSVVISDGPHVAIIGLSGVAVVATGDAILVVPLDRAQEVGALPDRLRDSDLDRLT